MIGQKVSTGINPITKDRSHIKKFNGFDDDQSGNSGTKKAKMRAQKILEILLPEERDYTIDELLLLLKTISLLEPAMFSDIDSYILACIKEVISDFIYSAVYRAVK